MTATIVRTLTMDHSGIAVRSLIGLVTGLAVTATLFWTMQYLIEINVQQLTEETTPALIKFVRIRKDEDIARGRWKPQPLTTTEPPLIWPPLNDIIDQSVSTYEIGIPEISVAPQMTGGFSLGVNGGDYLPIVKTAPIYPRRALHSGKQGFCVVVYTETRHGIIHNRMEIGGQCSSSQFHPAPENESGESSTSPE